VFTAAFLAGGWLVALGSDESCPGEIMVAEVLYAEKTSYATPALALEAAAEVVLSDDVKPSEVDVVALDSDSFLVSSDSV
jgi:hypothetical protein